MAAGSPSLRTVICVEPSTSPTLPASRLHACPLLHFCQRGAQRPLLFVDPSRPTSMWHLRSDSHSQCTQVEIDHRALDASDVDVQDPPRQTMPAPIPERHVRHRMGVPTRHSSCGKRRQQPGTFFSVLSSITLAVHLHVIRLCILLGHPPPSQDQTPSCVTKTSGLRPAGENPSFL